MYVLHSVMWIRISFNADPDPAFFVNADPDPVPDPDPDPGFFDTLNRGKKILKLFFQFFHFFLLLMVSNMM